MTAFVTIRQRTRANLTLPTLVWSVAIAAALWRWEVSPAKASGAEAFGVAVTVLFGAFLGWTRRAGSAFFLPLISWFVAFVPLWVAAMVRHGVLKGLVIGAILDSFGWLIIGTMEFMVLGGTALLVRAVRGPVREVEVTIIDPPRRDV
jgi:hypothetical protein